MTERRKKRPLLLQPRATNPPSIVGKGGICNAKTTAGNSCKLTAGHSTDHVGWGACKYHGGTSPALIRAAAHQQLAAIADELDVTPHEALLVCLRLSAGAVAWLRNQITNFEPDAEQPEALAALMDAYAEERDRLAKTSAMAISAGIDERRIELEEDQGVLIAGAIRSILGDLNLSVEQRREAPAIARRHLLALVDGGRGNPPTSGGAI